MHALDLNRQRFLEGPGGDLPIDTHLNGGVDQRILGRCQSFIQIKERIQNLDTLTVKLAQPFPEGRLQIECFALNKGAYLRTSITVLNRYGLEMG
jgi:hypothetical protein